MRKILAVVLAAVVLSLPGAAQDVKVAFLSIENLSGDPRYDYLEGITQGLLLYDLSRARRIALLDRNGLEDVLREQELRLSGLADNKAVEVGRLLGADWLLKGGYVFLGEDVLLNMTVIDVITGRAVVFSDRGSTENLIHAISEQIIQRLSGETAVLRTSNDRSIISLKDETPGSIALHSHLIDAQIILDGEFVGYSTGDIRVPYLIEGLRPGPHIVQLRLRDFGVVRLPEVVFEDWQETVDVKPGRRQVVRAKAYHFNDSLYDMIDVLSEDLRLEADGRDQPTIRRHELTVTDRAGREIPISLALEVRAVAERLTAAATLRYGESEERVEVASALDEENEQTADVGIVRVTLATDRRHGRWDVEYSIERTDIKQNMWR